jgi:CheY-like chemotaxis protein
MLATNLSGSLLMVQIERRERNLFDARAKLVSEQLELKRITAALEASDRRRRRVLAAVTHDIRQPLAGAALYLDSLKKNNLPIDKGVGSVLDKVRYCLLGIEDSISTLGPLLGAKLSRHATPETLHAEELAARVDNVFAALAGRDDVLLRVICFNHARGLLLSSRARLWEILANIVSNAIKFRDRRRSSVVVVAFIRLGDQVRCSVLDNGIGIPTEYKDRIFDEGFQIHHDEPSGAPGLGLGLSIVRGAIASLDGHSLSFHSVPGRGTRFDVYIPFVGCAHDADLSSPKDDVGRRRHRRVALVVEDDLEFSRSLCLFLEGLGFKAISSAGVKGVTELLQDSNFSIDCIVSDFDLPGGLNGLEIIDLVRRKCGVCTPAILVSGCVERIPQDDLLRKGVLALQKPVHPGKLQAELERFLGEKF